MYMSDIVTPGINLVIPGIFHPLLPTQCPAPLQEPSASEYRNNILSKKASQHHSANVFILFCKAVCIISAIHLLCV